MWKIKRQRGTNSTPVEGLLLACNVLHLNLCARNGILDWIEPLERIIADDGCAGCLKIIHPQQGRTDNTILRRILGSVTQQLNVL